MNWIYVNVRALRPKKLIQSVKTAEIVRKLDRGLCKSVLRLLVVQ